MDFPKTLDNIIEIVRRPLPIEVKNGYDNRSVTVGFGPYVVKWLTEARDLVEKSEQRQTIDSLISLFNLYESFNQHERRNAVNEFDKIITSFSESKPAKDIKVKKTSLSLRSAKLSSPVQYLKGVGPKIAKLLSRLGVKIIEDLIYFFPRDYEDRRNLVPIIKVNPGEQVLIRGTITKVIVKKTKSRFSIIKAAIGDKTGVLYAVWFNQPFMQNVLKKGIRILVSGKADFNSYTAHMELAVRDYEILEEGEEGSTGIFPKYSLTEGLFQKKVRNIVGKVLADYLPYVKEYYDKDFRQKFSLLHLRDAIGILHFPDSLEQTRRARFRLVFDDFFVFQLGLLLRRKVFKDDVKGRSFNVSGKHLKALMSSLPFELTKAQKRVFKEISEDMQNEKPMSRLLQGDVGSGKTVVAAMAMVAAVDNGCQAAIMAPTEILAQQHHLKISSLVNPLGIKTALLISSVKGGDRKKVVEGLKNGSIDIVVGTHALIEKDVSFKDLGFVVVDEQHRFGVLQRAALGLKGKNPDVLVMTATPIPRSLALVLYGDLDRSVIDELPPGRIPHKTIYIDESESNKAYEFIRSQVKSGRQAFVVCPLIEESEKLDLKAAKLEFEHLKKVFPEFKLELIHGRMKDKDKIMKVFKEGKINILVSTTVIEVGIDVPNATVMLIEHAERFGLAGLHQLRGRIGRGAEQSYCLLLANPKGDEAKARISAMLKSSDGFYIAEEDLKIRGPGEFYGTRQSGLPTFRIADIITDAEILHLTRIVAEEVVSEDPKLEAEKHIPLKKELLKRYGKFLELKTLN